MMLTAELDVADPDTGYGNTSNVAHMSHEFEAAVTRPRSGISMNSPWDSRFEAPTPRHAGLGEPSRGGAA
ncbi:hypothetical protein CU044_5440 [Streptomyces sp. L-9-10]|nr:hypothetical protein CU044_5440 [Streptomyces sp. L-9-10]